MASQSSNKNLEGNHDTEVLAVVIVFATLSVVAMVLRVISRRMKKNRLGVEDFLITLTLVWTSRNQHWSLR